MPEIISRKEARDLGLKRYFTGKPCVHGHVCERKTNHATCIECNRDVQRRNRASHKEGRREYWSRRRNDDPQISKRNSERMSTYWSDHVERGKELKQKWNRYNSARKRAWAKENSESVKRSNLKYELNGPKNPTGENQWLRKNRAQLRSVKRFMKNRRREQSQSSQAET